MATTTKERQQAWAARQRAQGRVPLTLWLPQDLVQAFRKTHGPESAAVMETLLADHLTARELATQPSRDDHPQDGPTTPASPASTPRKGKGREKTRLQRVANGWLVTRAGKELGRVEKRVISRQPYSAVWKSHPARGTARIGNHRTRREAVQRLEFMT